MSGNRFIAEIKFHNLASSPETGLECMITSDSSTLNIDFVDKGSNSTFTSIVEGKISYESDWDELAVVDTKTGYMTTKPNTFDTFQCDITGWSYIRVRLTSITGTLNVLGKLVG